MENRNKKYYQTLLLIIFFLTAYSLQLNATIRYVSKTGFSIPPYITWETAADSIQKCINISVFGDTIYVANGVYEELVVMIPGLSLIGSGTDSCVVDSRNFPPQGLHTIEIAESCLIKGFYICTSNNFNYGYGIYAETQSGLITENKFSDANTGIVLYGSSIIVYKNYFFNIRRGIHVANSNPILRKNLILMNVEGVSGIRVEAFSDNYTPVIDSNYIVNVNDTGIDKFLGTTPTIKNNVIIMKSGTGIDIDDGGTTTVANNIILNSGYVGINGFSPTYILLYNNYVMGKPGSDGIRVWSNSVVKNNVVTHTNRGIVKYGTQNPVVQYNNFWNNTINYDGITADTTNLSVDPMVINDDTTQGDLDFHLQKYSPLIDAGDPNILDKDGTRSDIGLYGGPYGESYLYQDLAPKHPRGLLAVVDTNFIILSWQRNTEADFSHYNLYRDTTSNFTIDSTKLVGSITDTFYLHSVPIGVNRLYFKLTGVDNQGNESNPSEEVAVILVTVKNEWKSINNYVLYQNYPNPFNPTTTIGYKLKERAYVKLYVYDVKGELVEVLVNQTQEAGYYEVKFNGDGKTELIKVKNPFVSGVYLCQIIVQNEKGIPVYSDVKKMILLK